MSTSNDTEKPALPDPTEEALVSSSKPATKPWERFLSVLGWTPPRCRHHPDQEFPFTLSLNLLFSLASTITVANLYYAYPVLNKIADDFDINYEKASLIPTLLQAGYGAGILLLCPLGDLKRLRPFILTLVLVSTTIWLGLCAATSFAASCVLNLLAGFTSVTPQMMLPLTDSIAPPARRVRAMSIVFAGLMFGQVLPRVLSGVVTEYADWRTIYWTALGLQVGLFGLLWLLLPDYEPNNPGGVNYVQLIWSVLSLAFTQPILAYGCLISLLSNAAMSSFWTILTALLASSAYAFSPMQIGLFSLVAIAPVVLVPLYSSFVIEHFAAYLATSIPLALAVGGVAVGTFVGPISLGGLIVHALAIDFGVDSTSVAYRTAIYSAVPKGRNRVNAAYTTCSFIGQMIGTKVGNSLYASGGWLRVGIASISFLVGSLVILFARGPREVRWFGWKGGYSVRKVEKGLEDR
ncbi:membrane protein [Colletotrichum sojae]|uniref:Membrane protein n=1 Tax=Colletotrichum sojae TaxID=2175907 RepID=A0A8H6IV43_9PEZI|nr:membrane protein [Colletotrichum sojae]